MSSGKLLLSAGGVTWTGKYRVDPAEPSPKESAPGGLGLGRPGPTDTGPSEPH